MQTTDHLLLIKMESVVDRVHLPSSMVGIEKIYPLLWHDIVVLKRTFDIRNKLALLSKKKQYTIVDVFEEHARRMPDKPCVLFEDKRYTYREVNDRANELAKWVWTNHRPGRGAVVAVLMNNDPVFVWLWFALAKLALVSSFLNTNLKPFSLVHCIKVCGATTLLCGTEYLPILRDILPELRILGVSIWLLGDATPGDTIPSDVSRVNADDIPRGMLAPRVKVNQNDTASLIFTSGTTGLPKASRITFSRIFASGQLTAMCSPFTDNDVVYTALPLYHSAGLVPGMLGIILAGGTSAIARKFSASRFWDDIRKHRATVFQYIGELCRYLLLQPERPDDGKNGHGIRMAVGNGLRPEIWERFKARFNIKHIVEFYGTTECSAMFLNSDEKAGAVGRYGWVAKTFLDNTELVECDFTTGQPIRGPGGKCIPVPCGVAGLVLHKLGEYTTFHGYVGPSADNERKVVRGVKVSGDVYFNSGDLMVLDADGYLHFKDRLGDTFRWKGENVSTLEVSQVICQLHSIQEANVYGVEVPGQEGRAGMAAIVMKEGHVFDAAVLYRHASANLPKYAIPRFIRLMVSVPVTGTFKHQKSELVRQGYDRSKVRGDPILVLDAAARTYKAIVHQPPAELSKL